MSTRTFPAVARPAGAILRIECAECGERDERPATGSQPPVWQQWTEAGWLIGTRPQLDFCATCNAHWSLPQFSRPASSEASRP